MEAEQLTNGIDDNETTEEVELVMMLPKQKAKPTAKVVEIHKNFRQNRHRTRY